MVTDSTRSRRAMKGKIVLFLFALPFAGIGAWMLYSIGSNLYDASRMQSWHAVSAELSSAGYRTRSGDDSNTYEAFAHYTYSFNGRDYAGTRVGLSGGADNIGDYHQKLGNRLSAAKNRGEQIHVYVNPKNPAEAVIDRSVRWGLVAFKSLFLILFGGFGAGLLIFMLRAPKEKDESNPMYTDRPWMFNDAWQTETIKSNSKKAMYGTWIFAGVWNLISAPLPFVMYREIVEKENYIAVVALLFPLVGIGLLVWAVRQTLEWRRFGPAPLALDPFPGAIGGHVGGTIDVNLPYDSRTKFPLTLTNIYSYISGSGKNRSRRERAKWQDTQIAHTERSATGTRLSFRFDVPAGLDESDAATKKDSHYLWRLNLQADLPGIDMDRDYEIPVYNTGEKSRHLSERVIESTRAEKEHFDDTAVRAKMGLRYNVRGKELHYPAGRNLGSALVGLIVGAAFGGIGWFVFNQDHALFGSLFYGFGSLVILGSFYSVLNSLQVMQDSMYLRSVRRILGIPVRRRQIRRDAFAKFSKDSSMQNQSGTKHVMQYTVYAEDHQGEKVVIGEGFKGESEANAAIRLAAKEFGLTEKQ